MESMVAELEGTILKNPDPFAYFMLVAFEASGPIRFAILLLSWPVIRLLGLLGKQEIGLRLTIFIAVAGSRISDIEYVGRAVLPKFYMDDLDICSWSRVFSQYDKKVVVVTKTPRVMVERFLKDHLKVDHVVGSELVVNRFGFATGSILDVDLFSGRVSKFVGNDGPSIVFGTASSDHDATTFKEEHNQRYTSLATNNPHPVIFHDGRLAKKPTPSVALLIILWLPVGMILGIFRMVLLMIIPMGFLPVVIERLLAGATVKVNGKFPTPTTPASAGKGVLFVCNHRTLVDPIALSHSLQRKIPVVTYSISRISEILSPVPTVTLTRYREVDKEKMKKALEKGDLVIFPEGTTCREPFLLRFSALFAELTDQIIPVCLNYSPVFFHGTTARGSKAFDLLYFCMNPTTFYEVTFLNKVEAKDISGKIPHEIANYVQSLLAATLGFTCTNYTRKDKYWFLAENDGSVLSSHTTNSWWIVLRKLMCRLRTS